MNKILCGDVIEQLRLLPDESVHCVVTSPPYWALRDYGVDGQIGLESTLEEYVAKMVEVFSEVRRVLRGDGVCYINLGDSYAQAGKARSNKKEQEAAIRRAKNENYDVSGWGASKRATMALDRSANTAGKSGLKPKDLCGVPWRVALALQADGWWLRSDIIWHKPNPMPSSVTDRCTTSHEYIFMLTKKARYFWDAEAVKEEQSEGTYQRYKLNEKIPSRKKLGGSDRSNESFLSATKQAIMPDGMRNKRSVWTIPTFSYPKAHFATFPPKLVEPCILSGTSAKGCCEKCGKPLKRIVEKTSKATRPAINTKFENAENEYGVRCDPQRHVTESKTVGWQRQCDCNANTKPCVVLDPFMGSGTVAVVAKRLGRDFVGIELNPEYIEQAIERLYENAPLLMEMA